MIRAQRFFVEALNLDENSEAVSFLQDRIQIKTIPENHLIQQQGANSDEMIVVVDGILKVFQVYHIHSCSVILSNNADHRIIDSNR